MSMKLSGATTVFSSKQACTNLYFRSLRPVRTTLFKKTDLSVRPGDCLKISWSAFTCSSSFESDEICDSRSTKLFLQISTRSSFICTALHRCEDSSFTTILTAPPPRPPSADAIVREFGQLKFIENTSLFPVATAKDPPGKVFTMLQSDISQSTPSLHFQVPMIEPNAMSIATRISLLTESITPKSVKGAKDMEKRSSFFLIRREYKRSTSNSAVVSVRNT
mmetsp:Transcript_37071/g.96078  ORF Transcript_37071/g.96078 Transcript_37071/m.96078 type:complete len:221 (-) Transcript_37071:851-1513(-)